MTIGITTPAYRAVRPTDRIPDEIFRPNVRPDGPEQSPDPRWRAWRLRQQRPEDRELMPGSFPNINTQLRNQDLDQIEQRTGQKNQLHISTVYEQRSIEHVRHLKPSRLAFRPLPEVLREFYEDVSTKHPRKVFRYDEHDTLPQTWFIDMSQSLFARVWEFAANTFGHVCLADRVYEHDWTDIILRKLPEEFINCASSVARGDPSRQPKDSDPNSYEHLFLAQYDRTFLVVGTIARLLEINVFNSLLFGATKDQADALRYQDITTDHITDGYQRNLARTNLIQQYFEPGTDLEPQDFWQEVDRVTVGILELLLPLMNFLGTMSPHSPWPPLAEVHQNLHNIVAEAAKLTNGIRICRSIFWIDFPVPGDLWNIRQEHADDIIFTESRRKAVELDDENFEKTPQMVDWLTQRDSSFQAAANPDREQNAWNANWEKTHPRPFNPVRRTAKVQISMWPSFTAHFPVRQNTTGGGGFNDGEEERAIMKGQVVYYAADESAKGDQMEHVTLKEHIMNRRRFITPRVSRRSSGNYLHSLLALLACVGLATCLWGLLIHYPLSSWVMTTQSPQSTVKVLTVDHATRHHTAATLPLEVRESSGPTSIVPKRSLPKAKTRSSSKSSSSTTQKSEIVTETDWEYIIQNEGTQVTDDNVSKRTKPIQESAVKKDVGGNGNEPAAPEGKTDKKPKSVPVVRESTSKKPKSVPVARESTSKKPKPVSVVREKAVKSPELVKKQESIKSPDSVSSPGTVASPTASTWSWLTSLDPRHLMKPTTGSNSRRRRDTKPTPRSKANSQDKAAVETVAAGDGSVQEPVTKPQPVAGTAKKENSFDEMKSASKASRRSKNQKSTSQTPGASKKSKSSQSSVSLHTAAPPKDTQKPVDEPVIQAVDPVQATLPSDADRTKMTTGAPEATVSSSGSAVESSTSYGSLEQVSRQKESPSSTWNMRWASVVTHVTKWTDMRVKTTTKNGETTTLTEDVPHSKESVSTVALRNRRDRQ